jgi:hypothetical protein
VKRSRVLGPTGVVNDDHVALRDEEPRRLAKIEAGEVGGEQLLQSLAASHRSRSADDVTDVVRGVELVDDVQVSLVPDLLFPAQNELFVLFSDMALLTHSVKRGARANESHRACESRPLRTLLSMDGPTLPPARGRGRRPVAA